MLKNVLHLLVFSAGVNQPSTSAIGLGLTAFHKPIASFQIQKNPKLIFSLDFFAKFSLLRRNRFLCI